MFRATRTLTAFAVAAALGVAGTAVATADEPPAKGVTESLREATAKYQDVNAALADGFVSTVHCESSPDGAMGIHFVNPARIEDPRILPTKPEVLLYEPHSDGSLELVGVEWFQVDPDQNLATDDGRPSVFGVPFNGPMLGHSPGMPIHFDLHAWVWRNNPTGTFKSWNPNVSCAGAAASD